jgi:hypothetical protein
MLYGIQLKHLLFTNANSKPAGVLPYVDGTVSSARKGAEPMAVRSAGGGALQRVGDRPLGFFADINDHIVSCIIGHGHATRTRPTHLRD